MIITYWNTLYKQISFFKVFGQITFSDDGIHFSSGGHRYMLEYKNVMKIESIND